MNNDEALFVVSVVFFGPSTCVNQFLCALFMVEAATFAPRLRLFLSLCEIHVCLARICLAI